ncbi:MAG: tetratricopeptide repeat protein [Pseudohongiellaceae bacterium]
MEYVTDQLLANGLAAYEAGELEEAERLFKSLLQAQPSHPEASHKLGCIALHLNDHKGSLHFFKKALEANPKETTYWLSYIEALIQGGHVAIAQAVLGKGRDMGLVGAEVDAIENSLRENEASRSSVTAKPNNLTDGENPPEQVLSQLIGYFKQGKFSEAEKSALTITKDFPEHPLGWKVLGVLHGQSGRNSEALFANQKATQLAPNDDEAHSNLGNVLRKLGRHDEAQLSCSRAIELNPELAENHNNLGVTLQEMGKLKEAEASYNKAISRKPNFVEAHSNLGGTLRALGKLSDAEASCRRVIALEPDFYLGHSDLGLLLKESGRYKEAESRFKRAIELQPNFAEAHNGLAGTFKELGRLEEAATSYRQALTIDPDFALAYCNLAVVLKDLGKIEEAEASCKQALAVNPDLAEAHYNLGALLFEKEKYQEAGEHFARVDIYQSELFTIKCSYQADDEFTFNAKLDELVQRGDVNAVIGSLSCCSEAKYGNNRSNPFCKKPLSYVSKIDLTEHHDFEKLFVKTAKDVLSSPRVAHKAQVHLSHGVQTAGNFFALESVRSTEIEHIIHQEIEKYRHRFRDSSEGFITQWPAEYELSGWLVSMQSGGSLTAHMHDTGWITGSLYINVPPKSQIDSGNLVLRMHDQDQDAGDEDAQELSVDVRTGSLCFFPSSLLHHTIPFEEDENRIVLAFDVIPKN